MNLNNYLSNKDLDRFNNFFKENTNYETFVGFTLLNLNILAHEVSTNYLKTIDSDNFLDTSLITSIVATDVFDYMLENTNVIKKATLFEESFKKDIELLLLDDEDISKKFYLQDINTMLIFNFFGRGLYEFVSTDLTFFTHLLNLVGKNLLKKFTTTKDYLIPNAFYGPLDFANKETLVFIANYLFIKNLSFEHIKCRIFNDVSCIMENFNYSYKDFDKTLSKYSVKLSKNYKNLELYLFENFKKVALKHNVSYDMLLKNKVPLFSYLDKLFSNFTNLDLKEFSYTEGYDELISTLN